MRLYRLVETLADAGHGACHLREPLVASLVERSLLCFEGVRYGLRAWVVMPNHVHALLTPKADESLSRILWSWKSFTAKEANKLLGRAGQFWQEDYFDRYIRDEGHFNGVVRYIEANPVKAGLCGAPEEWPFGSARLPTPLAGARASGPPKPNESGRLGEWAVGDEYAHALRAGGPRSGKEGQNHEPA
jgi:REP element-mobilizing transposase RayT